MNDPAYSVTPYGQDVAHTSSRQPGYVRVVAYDLEAARTLRAADSEPPTVVRIRRAPASSTPSSSAVESTSISEDVMRAALELAGGDPRRLVLHADGSVVVLNGVRR